MSDFEKYLEKNWSKKCPDYDENCLVCGIYKEFEEKKQAGFKIFSEQELAELLAEFYCNEMTKDYPDREKMYFEQLKRSKLIERALRFLKERGGK